MDEVINEELILEIVNYNFFELIDHAFWTRAILLIHGGPVFDSLGKR